MEGYATSVFLYSYLSVIFLCYPKAWLHVFFNYDVVNFVRKGGSIEHFYTNHEVFEFHLILLRVCIITINNK